MKALPRRTFLRGLGASIALPFLDAMVPALAAANRAKSPCRLMFVYAPTGVIPKYWFPESVGPNFDFPRTVKPFEKFRDDILFVSNLAHHNALALGDGGGDHARAAATYLTGMHIKKTGGADIRAGISVDQIAARKLGAETRFPSLELTCEDSRQAGGCDGIYSCAYQNMSWKSETQPLPPEMNPRQVFERLFGDLDLMADPAARARQQADRQSVLDLTLHAAQQLESNLGPTDKRKLDEYLTSIREVEMRIQRAEKDASIPPGFEKPAGIPTTFAEHAQLVFSLVVLAFQADLTRVATFMLAREGGVRTYPEIGVPEAHHSISHHRGDPALIEKVARISDYHAQQVALFLEKLKSTTEGDGTLLDHSVMTYGAALGDPNAHDHIHLPTLIAGRANGQIKPGRHVRYADGTPMSNLHLSLLDLAGVPTDKLGDATGKLDHLTDLS